MKKFLVLILSVVAVFAAILSLTACDNKNDNGGTTITDVNKSNDNIGEFSKNLRYELNDDKTGYVLTGIGLCEDVNIVMPSSYNNLPIVGIGEQAFYLNKSIIDIIISDNVENIGYEAFWNCSSLESVTIGNGVRSIGNGAFSNCDRLSNVTIGDGVTSIGEYAFGSCRKLTSVTIGDGVTSIGDGAFYGCTSLVKIYYNGSVNDWVQIDGLYSLMNYGNSNKELYMRDVLLVNTIIDTATEIKSYAFYNCASLTSVIIGDSVTKIINSAFENCSSLKFNEYDNAYYLGNETNNCTALIKAKSKNIIGCKINDNCKVISDCAFSDCASLTSVTIPDGVTSISDSAFRGCSSLESVTIGNGVTDIGKNALHLRSLANISVNENNKNYKSIDGNLYSKDGKTLIQYAVGKTDTAFTIPDSVTSISDFAFSGCSKLTSVTMPNSVTSIGDFAFYDCNKLTSVTIPDSVTSIGNYAFEGCGQLNYNEYGNALYLGNDSNPFVVLSEPKTYDITSCEINGNCKTINSGALALCESLTNISVDENNKNYKSIDGNLYSKDGKTLIQYAIGKTDTAFTIPDSVTSIGSEAFLNCRSLTSVTIPDSVTSIGDGAFYGCSSLTNITIGDGVTSIGDGAFWNCSSLTSVTIGKGVKSIGKKAFYSCYSIEAINYKGSKEQWNSISKGSDWNYGTGSFTINYNYVEN